MDGERQDINTVEERPRPYADDHYYDHLLDQYKLSAEMVDRISARRVLVNNSFITLMGAAAIAYSAAPKYFAGGFVGAFQIVSMLVSIFLAILWLQTILHYKNVADAKFKVLHEMEKLLPAQSFKMEHRYYEERRREKRGIFSKAQTLTEMGLPLLAALIAACALGYTALHTGQPGCP
jgi:hypothetical protein